MKLSQYFENFLKTVPPDTIVRNTMSGPWSAGYVINCLEKGDPDKEILIWFSSIVRTSRDFLMHMPAGRLHDFLSKTSDIPDISQITNAGLISLLQEAPEDEELIHSIEFGNPSKEVLLLELKKDSSALANFYKEAICKLSIQPLKGYSS